MEDLDGPRVVPGAAADWLRDLRWLGLDWDEGPDCAGARGPYAQSERSDGYLRALAELEGAGHVYPCTCTRREVAKLASIASAPHGELGVRYPGTCRQGTTHPDRDPAMRFRMDETPGGFVDGLCGEVDGSGSGGDFVVRRSDGLWSYQLAVVVDDIAQGITEVVRGDDLLASTPRQLALFRALGAEPPAFVHLPLVLDADEKRLSNRGGAPAVAEYRDAGHAPEALLGLLARSLGLIETPASITPAALIPRMDLAALSREPWASPAPGA